MNYSRDKALLWYAIHMGCVTAGEFACFLNARKVGAKGIEIVIYSRLVSRGS